MAMGRHKEWRKIAKRERRRRTRIQGARAKDSISNSNSTEHYEWLKQQEEQELFELEQIERINMQENEKWLNAEAIALKQWEKLQERRKQLRLQHLEEETKRRWEWESEQEKKRKEEERLKELEEENKRKQNEFINHLEKFLSGDSYEPPDELKVSRETKPNSDLCPFFLKTGCCRFGDQCSRNHRYPGISKVLLATNFFSHFGLENADEQDVDIMLEYEDSDTYKEFKDFFYDVLPEFEKFGRITQFKICNNYEKHLRGNTYVEFAELRCAVAAYRALHTRWYGGKQLSLQFCLISSWKNAICGLQSRKRCPKGRACNFLHAFRNPNNLFNSVRENQDHSERSRTPPRSWRWSESPEVEIVRRRRSRSRSSERRHRVRDENDAGRDYSQHERRDRRERFRREKERRENSCNREKLRERQRGRLVDSRRQGVAVGCEERRDTSPREINDRNEFRKANRHRHTEDKRDVDSPKLTAKRIKSSDIGTHRGSS